MNLPKLDSVDVKNKRVLMRVDYNVSMGRGLKIVDDTRIRHTLPTIHYLLDQGVTSITLIAHFGKPGGKVVPKLSLAPVAVHLEELLGIPVVFNKPGKVSLLENLRFDPREEENSPKFASELSQNHDLYVNEAFGESHRDVASITQIPKLLPSVVGFGFVEEVTTIIASVESPTRPFIVIIGGAKVSDKIGLLTVLQQKADYLLIGGGMANTFLAATGMQMGTSKIELDKVELATSLMEKAKVSGAKIILPTDVVVGDITVSVTAIPTDATAQDIGPDTCAKFASIIACGATIIWNGPMGVFEDPRFSAGTNSIYESLTKNEPAQVIVGGGDTLTAIAHHTHLERIDLISTGGGAMLTLIEKGTLVGLEALLK